MFFMNKEKTMTNRGSYRDKKKSVIGETGGYHARRTLIFRDVSRTLRKTKLHTL